MIGKRRKAKRCDRSFVSEAGDMGALEPLTGYSSQVLELMRNDLPWHYKIRASIGTDMEDARNLGPEFEIQRRLCDRLYAIFGEVAEVRKGETQYKDGFFEHHLYMDTGQPYLTDALLMALNQATQIRHFTLTVEYEGASVESILN
ncbi:MAG: hypothetical protein AB3N16_06125 [Flavobacteriaceae bacterium]